MAEFDKIQWQKDDRAANKERERLRSSRRYYADIEKSRAWAKKKQWKKHGIIIPDSAFPEKTHCEICGEQQKLHLDHNHATKHFRGWLCGPCNRMLGMARDNLHVLAAAARYLADRVQ